MPKDKPKDGAEGRGTIIRREIKGWSLEKARGQRREAREERKVLVTSQAREREEDRGERDEKRERERG